MPDIEGITSRLEAAAVQRFAACAVLHGCRCGRIVQEALRTGDAAGTRRGEAPVSARSAVLGV